MAKTVGVENIVSQGNSRNYVLTTPVHNNLHFSNLPLDCDENRDKARLSILKALKIADRAILVRYLPLVGFPPIVILLRYEVFENAS
jgi:hypothetical protein